ncbi:hypothetical protein [Mariprofundus ferrooxydans]|uniref:Uncharacterized protein n=1 Tax=Mariprofundus ferrooxydans PV-1 TaxID=314345 RepID=Q0EW84_9PROT|nr:hypothetical protein [Mariprofundus ferrooxydans]EAU53587.1 hypothetical protein SPV1_03078 [Mariprofundus ferrooxydans PV-1]KON47974.1 hypothetical protein AL013_05740 [Mariprofundus ferrooxydans]
MTIDKNEEPPQKTEQSAANTGRSGAPGQPIRPGTGSAQQQKASAHHHHKRHPHAKKGRWHHHKRRLLRLLIGLTVLALLLSSWAIYRSFEVALTGEHANLWKAELKQGHYTAAASQFLGLTNSAISQVFNKELSLEHISSDIKTTLPYLKKAGYTLTEIDIEVGVPPKVFVHFHHHGSGKVDEEQAMQALHDNLIGKALVMAISQAGKLQDKVEDPDMPFNHVEVELAPIPSVKIEYISPSKLHPWGNEKH